MERRIEEVRRVIEVSGNMVSRIGGRDVGVNDYLAEGWLLLNVYSCSIASDNGPSQYPVYVLGWTKDGQSNWKNREQQNAGSFLTLLCSERTKRRITWHRRMNNGTAGWKF